MRAYRLNEITLIYWPVVNPMEKRYLRKLRTDDDVASDSIQRVKDVRIDDIHSFVT